MNFHHFSSFLFKSKIPSFAVLSSTIYIILPIFSHFYLAFTFAVFYSTLNTTNSHVLTFFLFLIINCLDFLCFSFFLLLLLTFYKRIFNIFLNWNLPVHYHSIFVVYLVFTTNATYIAVLILIFKLKKKKYLYTWNNFGNKIQWANLMQLLLF